MEWLADIKRRLLNFLISLDQFLWSVVTLGNASPDETISAGCWRMEQQGKWQGKVFRPFIDWLFHYLQREHCRMSYLSELNQIQSNLPIR